MIKQKKVGILGGTFNPIHIGHLVLAENAYRQFELDYVLIMPASRPPHKLDKEILDDERRIHMIELAIKDVPYFRLSRFEIERARISYTADTLEMLSRKHPNTQYYFIMGADSIYNMETWYRPDQILAYASILVATRDFTSDERLIAQMQYFRDKYKAQIDKLSVPNIELSSEMIRSRVHGRQTIKYFVPENVERYIMEQGLYL